VKIKTRKTELTLIMEALETLGGARSVTDGDHSYMLFTREQFTRIGKRLTKAAHQDVSDIAFEGELALMEDPKPILPAEKA
jgi:hypothetical protein